MQGAIRLTAEDLDFQFADAYDPVLHERYQIGDQVCRCSQCKTILKTEHVDGSCPLCGLTPFVASVVNPPAVIGYASASGNTGASRTIVTSRKKQWLVFWCVVASFVALCPIYLFDMNWLFAGMATKTAAIIVFNIAFITSVILNLCATTQAFWQDNTLGPLLLAVPILAPYAVAAIVWVIIFILGVLLGLLVVVLIFGFLLAIFNS